MNSLPEAQAVLAAEFEGRPVNKQNISEWRPRAELVEQACQLSDAASDIADSAGDYLVDDLATVVSARYAQLRAGWDGQPGVDFQQRLRILRLLCQDVLQLQKGRQKATRLQLELEQHEKQEMELKIQQTKQRATAPIWAALWLNTSAESFGGGEAGARAAAHILEVQNGLAPGTLSRGEKSGTVKLNQIT